MGFKAIRVAAIIVVLVPTFAAQTVTPAESVRRTWVPTASTTQAADPQFGPRRNQEEPIDARLERQRQKAWNKDRFEDLRKDTDKLLKLATELKASVDKANKDTLSLEVVRKTEEVEKLAKQVREKMKATQ